MIVISSSLHSQPTVIFAVYIQQLFQFPKEEKMELYSRGWRIFWGGVVIVLMLGCAGLAIFVGAVRDGAAAPVVR